MKTQRLLASTPFVHNSVSHGLIVVPFVTFGSFNWPRLLSWIGFFTARWQWQHVRAARARNSKQNTRANIGVFFLHIWPSIISRAVNVLINVFGFYSHWKVWYKSEKVFGMCSEWHYTTRGLAYGDMTTRPDGLVVMSPFANLPRCVMPFWTHAHSFSLYDRIALKLERHCGWGARKISDRLEKSKLESRGVANLRDFRCNVRPLRGPVFKDDTPSIRNLTMWSCYDTISVLQTTQNRHPWHACEDRS